MTDKHTPSPWNAMKHEDVWYCGPAIIEDDSEESEANARLIAQAPFIPELKDILAVLVDHASERYPHFESPRGQRELKTARALLSRINGGNDDR